MSVLAHKITRAKWEQTDRIGVGEIPADAVTADLRTNQNGLSFWTCTSSIDEDLKTAVLALAAGAERIDKVEIAWLEQDAVFHEGLTLHETLGNTPVTSLRNRHVDFIGLDLKRLGKVADLISQALVADHYMRVTMKDVRRLIVQAVESQRVRLEDLKPNVRDEVAKFQRSTTVQK